MTLITTGAGWQLGESQGYDVYSSSYKVAHNERQRMCKACKVSENCFNLQRIHCMGADFIPRKRRGAK